MKILDFQNAIRDVLNDVETLVQGGCKAFSEDALDVKTSIQTQLQQTQGVALVVVTPDFARNGCASDGIPCDAQILVRCIEAPAVNRKKSGHLTALDAAEIVAHAAETDYIQFSRIAQTADERAGTVTATVTFNCSILLTND